MTSLFKTGAVFAALLMATAVTNNAYAKQCDGGHCSKVNADDYAMCLADGKAGSDVYVTGPDGKKCFCPCSCYITDDLISTTEGELPAGSVEKFAQVMTPTGTASASPSKPSLVNDAPALEISFDNGRTLTVSLNHALVLKGFRVSEASKLKVGDELVGQTSDAVTVTAIKPTKYTGTFHNFILDDTTSGGRDRVLFAAGVLNGDWKVQSERDRMDAEVGLREVIAGINAKK